VVRGPSKYNDRTIGHRGTGVSVSAGGDRILQELNRELKTAVKPEVFAGTNIVSIVGGHMKGSGGKGKSLKTENPVAREVLDVTKHLTTSSIGSELSRAHMLAAGKGKDFLGIDSRRRTIGLKIHHKGNINGRGPDEVGTCHDAIGAGSSAENGDIDGTDLTTITGAAVVTDRGGRKDNTQGPEQRRSLRHPGDEGEA